MSTSMSGTIFGVSTAMFTSVATGLALLVLTAALFWLMLAHRDKQSMHIHKLLTWTLVVAAAIHGAWGLIAVFVLKS